MKTAIIITIFNLRIAAFKAYCAIWVRSFNFRHQASPRVDTREHPAAEGGTLGEKCPGILSKCRFPHCIQGSFICRKATTWDRRLYFPSEGKRAEEFFALKIWRLRPAANPRTWVTKATKAAIKTAQLKLYREIIALCSEIHAKHINAMWAEHRISECQIWRYKR
jgi:hypothetical protein